MESEKCSEKRMHTHTHTNFMTGTLTVAASVQHIEQS